jgi:hypothetical protein
MTTMGRVIVLTMVVTSVLSSGLFYNYMACYRSREIVGFRESENAVWVASCSGGSGIYEALKYIFYALVCSICIFIWHHMCGAHQMVRFVKREGRLSADKGSLFSMICIKWTLLRMQ